MRREEVSGAISFIAYEIPGNRCPDQPGAQVPHSIGQVPSGLRMLKQSVHRPSGLGSFLTVLGWTAAAVGSGSLCAPFVSGDTYVPDGASIAKLAHSARTETAISSRAVRSTPSPAAMIDLSRVWACAFAPWADSHTSPKYGPLAA